MIGLRGAIAFALSINLDFDQDKRHVLITTTLIIVLFTLLVLGGSTLPLLKVRAMELFWLIGRQNLLISLVFN